MSLSKEQTEAVIKKFGKSKTDTGSTSVQIALLTLYDMCKAVDRGMVLQDIALLSKQGGKSGTWTREG